VYALGEEGEGEFDLRQAMSLYFMGSASMPEGGMDGSAAGGDVRRLGDDQAGVGADGRGERGPDPALIRLAIDFYHVEATGWLLQEQPL
jgi:hypothetical protein